MEEIINMQTIDQYNKFYDVETLHPLVSVIDFSKAKRQAPGHYLFNMGFYTIFLKELKCGDMRYGRKYYDYQEGTLVCIAPGQVYGFENVNADVQPKALGLLFHPDLIRGTQLGQAIKNYSFFSYESNEALHLSEQEKQIIKECFGKISYELQHAIDKHSKRLITTTIELLLDYCMRFYDRQFITRENENRDILVKFEKLIDEYFQNELAQENGLPTVKYFADKVFLSPNYFGDLVKKETGKSAKEYIQLKIISIAKDKILETDKTMSQIAYELGFQYPQHFSRLFKKIVGKSPNEYKATYIQ
jgi:AraC-like DNA-binding protein